MMNPLATSLRTFGSLAVRGVPQAISFVTNGIRGLSTPQKVAVVSGAVVLGIAVMASMQTGSFVEHLKTPATKYWPFSDAVLIRGFNVDQLELSGKMGTVGPSIIPGGILEETQQMMRNINSTLENAGFKMENLTECKLMIVDIDKNWKIVSDEYAKFFSNGIFPARSAFGVSGLALGGLVEGTCRAVKTTSATRKIGYLILTIKSFFWK